MFNRKIIIFSLLILLIVNISLVSASEDASKALVYDNDSLIDSSENSADGGFEGVDALDAYSTYDANSDDSLSKDYKTDSDDLKGGYSNVSIASESKIKTTIKAKDIVSFYKDKSNLSIYLMDSGNNGISNRTLKLSVNNKSFIRTSDDLGKASFSLDNLKPGNYLLKISFMGDSEYEGSSFNSHIKIKKAPLAIQSKDYKTYFRSDLFLKVKVINRISKNPIEGIKVLFNVYSSRKNYKNYYAITDKNGFASLNRNLKVGSYDVYTYVADSAQKKFIEYRNLKNKVVLTVLNTSEMGCSSIYVPANENESAVSFRRDSTYAAPLYIVAQKWHGRTAVKQYKLVGTYFFHAITTSDGWMMGTGGWDNPSINRKIENLAGQMVSSNAIQKSKLNTIRRYQQILTIGHFAIVAPDGRYAVVWKSGYVRGVLKNGEYLDVPNARSLFRHGKYSKFSTNVATAAHKIAAYDVFGRNRRNIMTYHYKRSTKNYKTTSSVTVYGANDKGNLIGRHTAGLIDHVHYKKTFISKYKLSGTPNKKLIGTHNFGNIDKLIKTPTKLSSPKVTNNLNESKYFKVTLRNKKTNNLLKGVKINLKVYTGNSYKNYVVTTNKSGVAHFNTKVLNAGTHKVIISPANHKYIISGNGTIIIKDVLKNKSSSSNSGADSSVVNSSLNSSNVSDDSVSGLNSSDSSVGADDSPNQNLTNETGSEDLTSGEVDSKDKTSLGLFRNEVLAIFNQLNLEV